MAHAIQAGRDGSAEVGHQLERLVPGFARVRCHRHRLSDHAFDTIRGKLQGPCTPGGLVIPGLNVATLNVPLIAPGIERTPRLNQVDLPIGRWIIFERRRINPKIDLFNALNSSDY